jgi:hypothetical protein
MRPDDEGRVRNAFANLGAEEPAGGAPVQRAPVERLSRAFVQLVEATEHDVPWPALAALEGLVPWLSTDEAAREAARLGVPYAAAAPDVTRRVHDKAFALAFVQQHAQQQALGVDDALTALARAFSPEELTAAALEAHMESWPAWARARATLKPRMGTSGRGRVPLKDGCVSDAARGALERLRTRGGCVLEPFVTRALDVSALLFVPRAGEPALLGSTLQEVSASGVYRGCRVVADVRGAPRAGTPIDDVVERDALRVARAAQQEGFWGFCGVDAFSYDGGARVRTVVELNARFTAGHVALALALRETARPGDAIAMTLDDDELWRPA